MCNPTVQEPSKETVVDASSGRPTYTTMGVFLGQFRSPATLLFFGAIGAMLVGNIEKTSDSLQSIFIVAAVLGATLVASFLVSKIENSEWRQQLRADVVAKEAKMGVSHEDKVTAASNMSLQPPEPIAPKEHKKEE
mmetsp:Transcript_138552/g.244772  ORF Transcript_138552/g.244772 Transcript_138552/m.244772 type:complete len:136 (+) Transcript_138552:138-545(+)